MWRQLSGNASRTARQLAAQHAHVAVVAIDTPFAGTARAYLDAGPLAPDCGTVNIMQALCGTARLNQHDPDLAQLAWEQRALSAAGHHGVTIADISPTFTAHLRDEYNVSAAHLTRFPCSLDLTDPDLQPMPPVQARRVAAAYGVPLDRPTVLAVGRTDPVKGLDQLITALIPLADLVHLVAVIVPFDKSDPLTHAYQQQIADAGIRATYVDRFSRELPRALASLPNTAAVACPSRSESQGYLPLEVALWARHGGPIVVAPALGGFTETIIHERTGLLYDPETAEGLTAAILAAIKLPAEARTAMAQQAYHRVTRERDVVTAYADTLSSTLLPA
ncbi:glycosyltransferase family 4 protein [Actinoplanes sp. NPDC051411]|uniref:glycosyltransferase family 4 protein n=1 Tax=Actinoplanes sp. NPDC051411 TaxID=3155522 RepID=UPI0034261F6B